MTEEMISLSAEVRELYLGEEVLVLDSPPTSLEFLRLVSRNKPVLIKGAISHWPALSKWDNSYLKEKLAEREVTVAITPHGLADSVREEEGRGKYFVQPLYEKMKFKEFMERSIECPQGPTHHGVHYIQLQNDSLRTEFQDLLEDVDFKLDFAIEALGREPEAVNFWMGEDHSITSLHKDHYENLYGVVSGEKHFILYPPTDIPFLYEHPYPSAEYVRGENGSLQLRLREDDGLVPWISVDPLKPDYSKFPLFQHAKALRVTVKAGELLFLPSLFYHHVAQTADREGRCLAVNFWFDMEYDLKFAYFQFLHNLSKNPRE